MSLGRILIVMIHLLSAPLAVAGDQAGNDESTLMFEGVDAWMAVYPKVVVLSVVDDVSDGCMPRPNGAQAAWEAELRRLGFQVVERGERDFATPGVAIMTFGYGTDGGGCVVNVETVLTFFIVGLLGEKQVITPMSITMAENLMSGPKLNMQTRIEDLSRDHARSLYLRMEKTRERFKKEYPIFMANY